ncbi:MAG: N-acetylmuramic acid 6-phosphate etherase [Actinomycetia bacterium]|nr:N-acetylmuramic acid 6-phosphate etherase [Actinomycetes bacterium]
MSDVTGEIAGLTTEQASPDLADIDTWPTDRLVAAMIDADRGLYDAVAACQAEIASAVDQIAERLGRGGRLFYLGAGTAGRLGVLDASEIPPTFGTDPSLVVGLIAGGPTAITQAVENAEDDRTAAPAQLRALGLDADDAVVGIAASGRTPYVLGGLGYASAMGALTVGVTSNAGSAVGREAQIAIDVVVGPEFIAGSTRLRAGTAQKLVLNLLSTLTMVRLGKTYGNRMVDLRATNAKLRARAEQTVVAVCGCPPEVARDALAAAGGHVKTAVLMLLAGVDQAEATRRLEATQGHLRQAL